MDAARIALVALGYLLGTFPTAHLVGRRLGFDPTMSGSGNPGASNTTRVGGRKAGAMVLLGDLGKGVVASGAGVLVADRTFGWVVGAAAVLGHIWPVTRRFQGGKGVATAAGVTIVCAPVAFLIVALLFIAVVKATGKAAPASLSVSAALPAVLAGLGRPAVEVAVAGVLAVAIVYRHADNIRRLLDGTEATVRGETDP